MLQGFAEKDMIEQIIILDEIKDANQVDVLPELIDLYAMPLGEQAVDEVVYHTLFSLMAGQTQDVINGLKGDSDRVKLLCVRRAGEDADESVMNTLVEQLQSTDDPEVISEIIRSLGYFKDSSLTSSLIPFLDHEDSSVAAWAMQSLVTINSEAGRKVLQEMMTEFAEKARASGDCDLKTAQLISSIASYKDQAVAEFLADFIHHPSASFRRVVITSFTSMGEVMLSAMERCLASGDKDEKIMATNILGWSGLKKGAVLLISLLDQGGVLESNLKFAIYEALGRIPSMRSSIALVDGLHESDEMVLMAVITGLNDLCNPGVITVFSQLIEQGGEQQKKVIGSVINGQAENIFRGIYQGNTHGKVLIDAIVAINDKETSDFFIGLLEKIEEVDAEADIKRLATIKEVGKTRRIFAADDSKAMLFFYKGAAADMGVELITAADGKEALEYLQTTSDIDLIITDMNMPNMDGIELTKELRKLPQWAEAPILMATTESEKSQSDLARQAGVDDFLSKPFSKDILISKIDDVLGKSG